MTTVLLALFYIAITPIVINRQTIKEALTQFQPRPVRGFSCLFDYQSDRHRSKTGSCKPSSSRRFDYQSDRHRSKT